MIFFIQNKISEFQIWHSPQKRARLTGEILTKSLQIPCKNFIEKDFLNCGQNKILNNLPTGKDEVFTMLVSHEPDIEYYLNGAYSVNLSVRNCDIFIGKEKL